MPLGNTKFYKEDWLWGYKQIGTPKSLPNKHLPLIGSGLNNFTEQKKQGGSKKKQPGFQVLTDANGKYVFVKT